MSHRINIEEAVEQAVAAMLEDPDGRDVETERDDLLAVIYGWHQEQIMDVLRAAAQPRTPGAEHKDGQAR